MRTVPRPGRPGVIRVRLLGRREGSASAFRINSFGERPKDVVHVAEDVRVNILLGKRKELEGHVRVTEHFETILDREDGIGRCKVVGSIESIPEPKQDMVVHDEGLHLSWFVRHDAHAGFLLSYSARANLLLRPLDVRKHHIAKHCNPVHALRGEVLNRTVEGVVGVRSQTLE